MFMGAGQAQQQVSSLLAAADAQQARGQIAEAMATLRQAKDIAHAGGGPALTAQAAAAIGVVQAAAGQGVQALAAMQEAAELFGLAGDRASQARALIQVASLQAASGQFDTAKNLLGSCLATAGQLADSRLTCEVRLATGQLLLSTRYAAGAASEFRAGLAIAIGLPDAIVQVQLRAYLAIAVHQCGQATEAITLLTENAKVAQQIPDGIAGAMGLSTVSDALLAIQRPLDALAVGKQALARLQLTGAQPLIIQALIGLANLYALTGQAAEAASHASQAIAAGGQLDGPAGTASVLLRLGAAAMQRGDAGAAADLLRQARSQLRTAGLPEPPMLTQMLGQLSS